MDSNIIIDNAKSKRRQVADLEKMVGYGALSAAGRDWLIQAIDPFHDSEVSVTGYPDMVTTPSICQAVRQSITIACPTTVTTGTWDCNIANFPCPYAMNTTGIPYNCPVPGVYSTNGATVNPYVPCGVTSYSGPSGTQGFGTTSNQWQLTGGVAVPTPFTAGPMRVVGCGVEIINTTSALNAQGLCTVWRQSCPVRNTCTIGFDRSVGGSTAPTSWATSYEFVQPPGTLAQAQLLEGSRQWHAKEGAYLVNTMADLSNPPQMAEPIFVTAVNTENSVGSATGRQVMTANNLTQYGTTGIYLPSPTMIPPYNMCGAYFTGLSLQTTLTINAIWYIERFPTPIDTNLVVLTSPSPAFDPVALELYGRALQETPAGVMLKENPFGEWFQDLIHNIASSVSPMLKGASVLHPGFGVAGSVADMFADATSRNKSAQKANNQKQKRQQQRGQSSRPTPSNQPTANKNPAPRRRRGRGRGGGNQSGKSEAPGRRMEGPLRPIRVEELD